MVSEGLVHGCLAEHHGGRVCGLGGCLPDSRQEAEREREGDGGPGMTSKGTPPAIYFLQLGPTS
jgi:hypothetical protein